jgi:lipopolysaccharide transport system permease protein/teichoic acid transport system permease protein
MNVFNFARDIIKNQKFIIELATRDVKTRFTGSYLGAVWAFVQPTVQVLIFWFVFQVGFKSMPVDNFPFILWLVSAMIPWFFIADGISGATNSIIDNSYLVQKVVFRVSFLPIMKIYSAFLIHIFFLAVLFVMFMIYGYYPDIYNIQIIYYTFCSIVIVTGLSWLTSSLVIFLKDIGQFVTMMLQFGFWLTPIFYSLDIVPEKYHFIMKINPFYYITEGFRDSFIYKEWFWDHPMLTLNFWIIAFFVLFLGGFVFKKLRPHFADVL